MLRLDDRVQRPGDDSYAAATSPKQHRPALLLGIRNRFMSGGFRLRWKAKQAIAAAGRGEPSTRDAEHRSAA